jgi:O-antigen/teichoic acid export membrane protein
MEMSVETAPKPSRTPALKIGGHVLARNTALNVAGQIIPLLVGIVTMPYVIRRLGPDRFGLLSLAWLVVGYFALLDFGIGPATTKFVAELLGKGEIERLPALVWTAVATQTGFGLVAGILFAAASPALSDRLLKIPAQLQTEAHWIFVILAISLPIGFATGTFQGVLGASQRFDLVNAISLPSAVLYYLIPAMMLALGFGLRAVVFGLVASRVMAFGGYSLLCLRLYPVLRRAITYQRSLVRPLLGFGGWVTVSGAVIPILTYFDRFFVGGLLSVAAIGFYTPPFMISSKLIILPASLTAALFPAFSTSYGRGDNEWISIALVRSLKYVLLMVGAASLALIFFARPILTLWVGARFAAEGTLVLQILTVGTLINSLAYVPSNLLQGVGRPDLTAKFHLLEVPFHLGLLWFLVTKLGLPGAALAFSARVTLDFLLLIIAALWVTHSSPRLLAGRDVLRSLATLAALALGFLALWVWSHTLLAQILLSLLLAAGFLVVTWHYILDLEEKGHIRQWVKVSR